MNSSAINNINNQDPSLNHSEKNIKFFYKLYFENSSTNKIQYEDFKKKAIYEDNINTLSDMELEFYLLAYKAFWEFNNFYKNFSFVQPNFFTTDVFIFKQKYSHYYHKHFYFYVLNYGIGNFNPDTWKMHSSNVKETLKFINDNKSFLEIAPSIENLNHDIEILNNFFYKYYYTILNGNLHIDELDNFSKELESIDLKNSCYKQNTINSIINNVSYINKHLNILRFQLKITDKKTKEIDKIKDFFLITSGAAVTLTSMIVGNLSMSNNNIFSKHIVIFNISILTAILIFSHLFNFIYNKDTETVPNKFYWCFIAVVIFIFLSAYYNI